MSPRFKDGEPVYVDPRPRVVKGDDCVIQVKDRKDGEQEDQRIGWVKEFVSENERQVKVKQYNPAKTMTFDKKYVVSVHKIVWSGRR